MLFSSSPIRRRTFSCMRGDLTIRGTEYRPNGEKLPIAIVCHGFMANQQTVRQYTRVLAKLVTARTVSTSAAAAFHPWCGVTARRRTCRC